MKDRVILHCDLNSFFASVSLLFNPTLKNLPVAVCGDRESRHGIVLAKNEIAKGFGVKTAEAIFEAKEKCPQLVILPPVYEKYREYSVKARRIYERYTDMIEPFGIDECWLDVTGSTLLFGSGEQIAERIRTEIKTELGITVSVGVSFNKIFAKLGSDMKKPDAVTVIDRESFKEKVWGLPVSDLLFVGKRTCDRLRSHGINTIGDITLCSDSAIRSLLGKNGEELKRYALGEDNSPVVTPSPEDKPKSMGKSVTRAEDFTCNEEVWKAFLDFSQYICDELRKKGLYAGGVQIHLRTASLTVKEFTSAFRDTTDSALILAERGFELFKKNYAFSEPLRSVGLRAVNLKSEPGAVQCDIFGEDERRGELEKIEDTIYELRQKFGSSGIKRGRSVD